MSEEYSAELQEKIDEYRAKMEEIAENKSFLPVRFFEDHEGFIRSEILRSYDRKDSQQVLQQALLSWRSELYSRNQAAIFKWCNELLADSTGAVDKKICREVKSFTTYRQEILTTLDLLRKKTEVYLTSDLSLLIHDTILQKIFEHVGQLHNSAVSQLQDHLKMLEIENKALTVECKEAKRRTNKEDSDFQRTISELREKLSLADVKYSLLEQGNEQLRQQLHSCQESKDEAFHRLNEEFNTEASILRTKLEERSEETREAIKRSTFLEMELQKEQLLHKQTMLHYQELIANYHSKEQVLKEEFLEASRVSEQEIDQFRLLSTRRIEDWQQTANDFEEQLEKTQKELKDKQSQACSLRENLTSLKETSRFQIEDLTKRIAQLEYHNKVLEEKESELQQIKFRLLKMDGELKKAQRDRDQLGELCKEAERQRLKAEQKHQFLKVDFEKEQGKVAGLNEQLKQEREKNQFQNTNKAIDKTDGSSQTEDDLHRQKLKAALALIRQMEADYRKLQHPAMRRTYM